MKLTMCMYSWGVHRQTTCIYQATLYRDHYDSFMLTCRRVPIMYCLLLRVITECGIWAWGPEYYLHSILVAVGIPRSRTSGWSSRVYTLYRKLLYRMLLQTIFSQWCKTPNCTKDRDLCCSVADVMTERQRYCFSLFTVNEFYFIRSHTLLYLIHCQAYELSY